MRGFFFFFKKKKIRKLDKSGSYLANQLHLNHFICSYELMPCY